MLRVGGHSALRKCLRVEWCYAPAYTHIPHLLVISSTSPPHTYIPHLLVTSSTSSPHTYILYTSHSCSSTLTLADSDIRMSVNTTSFKEAMGWRYPDRLPNARQRVSPRSAFATGHRWTAFEREVLLGLMASQHHNGDPLELATMLNKALNDSDYHSDISTHDIHKEVKRLLLDHPNFAGFLARHNSGKMTRQLKRVFHRDLKYSAYRERNGSDRVRWVPHLKSIPEITVFERTNPL